MSNVFGDAENNILGGTSNDDLINGYGGDDELSGGGGNDLLNGGADADTLKGGGGIDTLNGDAGVDNLKGGGGNDTLNGGAGNDIDILAGGKGSDTLDGGEGNDIYEVTAKDFGTTDTFSDTGTSDGDEIDADKVLQLMLGGDFNALDTGIESIRGDVEDELEIIGDGTAVNWDFTGIDLVHVSQITGSGYGDEILGSDGDDKIKGGGGNDGLGGGDGVDNLAGGGGSDTVDGGDGDDKVKGGGGDDTLTGGAGNDTLTGGAGNDIMDGGEDSDTYVYKDGESLDDDDIEDTGTGGTDVVDLTGVAAIELGDDVSASGAGIEAIHGAETGTVLHAGEASEGVEWDFGGSTLEHITEITGSGAADYIVGSDSDDKIKSGAGDDDVSGGDGHDNLAGGGGNDHLDGNAGDDNLKGGNGDDMLWGAQGDDTLKGGGGNDTLVYSSDDVLADGQDDTDTLLVQTEGSTTLDITDLAGVTLKNIEVVELGGGDITLVLDKASLQAMSDTSNILTVNGGAGDSIVTSGTVWTQVDNEGSYYVYTNGLNAILRVLEGVNRDGIDTPADEAPHLDVDTGGQLDEGGTITITSDMLSASDIDSDPNELVYKVTELPSHGSILVDGVALLVNGTFTQAQVDANLVEYENAGDDGVMDGFSFTLSDAGNPDVEAGGLSFVINADITGDGDDEEINGGAGNDTLNGAAGNDILSGHDGDDALNGGGNNDTLYGGDGIDALNGEAGGDHLWGESGDDVMHGGSEGDVLIGGFGNDVMYGDDGSDFLAGDAGTDQLYGGDGGDTYSLHDLLDVVVEAAGEGNDKVQIGTDTAGMPGGTYDLTANVEYAELFGASDFNVNGNELNNVLDAASYSTGGANVLDGAGGNDYLWGGEGNDTLSGGDDNDTINGGAGNDTLAGGDGDDVYYIEDDDDTVVEAADDGIDLLHLFLTDLGAGYTIDANVENATLWDSSDFDIIGNGLDNVIDAFTSSSGVNMLDGAGGNDTLLGGAGNDTLNGGAGNDLVSGDDELNGGAGEDSLNGGGGQDTLMGGTENDTLNGDDDDDILNGNEDDDTLNGGAGNDILNGGAGNDLLSGDDILNGGTGNDWLNGGGGNDTLTGGTGEDDNFVFDTALGATNVDSITDFEGAGSAGGDVIQLYGGVFGGMGDGVLSAGNFVTAATAPVAGEGDDYILYAQDTGFLYYDADGDGTGAAVHFATVEGSPNTLDAGDFVIFGAA